MASTRFDFIVIGGGTAGCLLANRLSADPAHRVLLLEAGGHHRYHWIDIPVGYLYCIGNPRTDWCYQTAPEPGLNGRALRYPRGRVLGGCSAINGMIYMRGQARDYDSWASVTGDDAWRWSACLPDFMRHEDYHGLDQPGAADRADTARHHGHGGEWRVARQRLQWDILDAFAEAAQQAGLPACDDFNRGDNEGVGYFDVNQRHGWRWHAGKAFIRPARQRPNLTVWLNATVDQLSWQPDADGTLRCTGAWVRRDGERVAVTAHREVILSAGAIGSPLLLQRSGIGPADVLTRHGVKPRLTLPGVGGNLQDHLQIRTVYAVQGTRTLNTLAATPWGKARIGLEYLLHRRGPMSMAPSQLGAFTRSDPGQPHANLQYHVQPLSLDTFGEPLHRHDAFTASVCHLNPSSRGQVSLTSPDPDAPPLIQPGYLATPEDRRVAADALRVTRRIVAQPALARWQPQEIKPGLAYDTDDALAQVAGDIGTTIFHPVGTARMGRDDDPHAVVDSRLRVRGVRGLRVVDASVMPTITSGNTNSPTLMIAEKAAGWITDEARRR